MNTSATHTPDKTPIPPPHQALILVVDDNPTNCELLVRRLERRGFATLSAGGGLEALKHIETRPVDIVLLDINMPDVDGLQVLKRVRQSRDQSDLPIIMVSAHGESESIADAINQGANDYITKPVDFPVALARIKTQLDVKRAHEKLKESEERYALAFRGANDGLWDWDLRTGQIFYSDRWRDMLGLGPNDIGNAPEDWFARVHPDEVEDLKHAIESHLLGQTEALEHEYRALHEDGNFRWLLTRGVASRGADGQAVRISGSQTDVTRSKVYDPITSIPNKFLFMDRLEWLLDKERHNAVSCFAVFLIKIDRLSEVRQTLGPVAGEDILAEAATRLAETLRGEEALAQVFDTTATTISRHDEADFAILVEGCRDETATPKLAKILQARIYEPFEVDGQSILLTASIGIYTGGQDDTSAQSIIQHTANALERARAKGPGSFELFDRNMQTRALKRLKMETELRRAIAEGGLHLNYQPFVDLRTGEISGCEALCRWTHPELGQVSPVDFIPLAEETGMIDAIGDWVLEEACRQHQKWREEGGCDIDMSVNISVKQMQRHGIADHILGVLARSGMDPERLKIEITESIFMEDMARTNAILSTLHDKGVSIAIDDYGTGYSSLAYLKRLPITHLKIDRSFTAEVSTDLATQTIVQSTLLMAQSLGIQVVVEGLETEDQLALLKVLKAEFAQGYYFYKPLPPEELGKLL